MGVLNAGDLDRLIRLYHQLVTQNPQNGEKVITFPSAYATPYAKRLDLSGTKRIIARQTVVQRQTEWTIRFRDDVSAADRVVEVQNGLTYEILDIAEIGRREGLCLLCRAVLQ